MMWVLGVLFACACGIINVVWLEHEQLLSENEDENNASKNKQ